MHLYECEQGSPEWKASRAGVITASMVSTIRAKVGGLTDQQKIYVSALLQGESQKVAMEKANYQKAPVAKVIEKALQLRTLDVGEWSGAAKNYAFRLACERIAGEPLPDDGFETYAMRRGRELEEPCRRAHERDIGQIVDLAGFITTDDRKFGCSADSLVGDDGGAEYKCFYSPESVRPILLDDDWGDIKDQVQTCLWLTGRKWWDQCLYFPSLDIIGKGFIRKRVERDESYIEAMELDLIAFDKYVCEIQTKLRS